MRVHLPSIAYYGLGLGGLALGWHFASEGALGPSLQGITARVESVGQSVNAPKSVAPLPVGSNIPTQGYGGVYGQLPAMVQSNPQFVGLMQSWQNGLWQRVDYPTSGARDWNGFRTLLKRLGYSDPGPNPPQAFARYPGA